MESRAWTYDRIQVILRLGPSDDSELDVALRANNIPIGIPTLGMSKEESTTTMTTAREACEAEKVVYWPAVSIYDSDRRNRIFRVVSGLIEAADGDGDEKVGISTLGPEIGMVPAWEIAEEITKAIYMQSKREGSVRQIDINVMTAAQFDSFVFTLNNVEMYVV